MNQLLSLICIFSFLSPLDVPICEDFQEPVYKDVPCGGANQPSCGGTPTVPPPPLKCPFNYEQCSPTLCCFKTPDGMDTGWDALPP